MEKLDGFQENLQNDFVYEPHANRGAGAYRARRRPVYAYQPIIQAHSGAFQIQAVNHQEIAYVQPIHRTIETFERPQDTYDIVRKFNSESILHRPMDGKAFSYLKIGPWLRLRLLKSTIHITRQGTPPFKAFLILSKHLRKQVRGARKPRIVVPVIGGHKKLMTLATTERLDSITLEDLAKLCERGLKKRAHHIIYRQSNVGGPLFEFAKNNEVLI